MKLKGVAKVAAQRVEEEPPVLDPPGIGQAHHAAELLDIRRRRHE